MGYFLFILVTATLFIRPGEIVADFRGWPIYEVTILACLAVSVGPVLKQLSLASLKENPITACVVGLLAAVVLSHLVHFRTYEARQSGTQFLKVVIYYLLLVANIDSEPRFQGFLKWLLLFIFVLALLAILSAYRVIELPGIEFMAQRQYDKLTGEMSIIPRLQSTGIFSDPNDLAMILVAGVCIALSFAADRAAGLLRLVGLPVAAFFGYSIYLTQSRGGLLALMAALLTLCQDRWGWKRTVWIAAVVLPVLLVAFKGRMTNFDEAMGEDTGQSRVQLWSEGIALFRQQPLFGIGQGSYADEVGMVAHNSFVHAFTELGLFGGAIFLGAFVAALTILYHLRKNQALGEEGGELTYLLPYLMAMLVGFAVSMLSLSRNYGVPTYLMLGLATAYARITVGQTQILPLRVDSWFLKRLALSSVCFLVVIYLFIRVTGRWS